MCEELVEWIIRTGLSKVMRYQRPNTADECRAMKISRPVTGANMQSEKREYTIIWVKVGVGFEHFYTSDEWVKPL